MPKMHELVGSKFGRLTVCAIKQCENSKRNLLQCQCECGNTTFVSRCDLVSGKTKSCGCLRKETTAIMRKTHGQSNSRLYRIWNAMKERCQCTTNIQYKDYGGRGIAVCDEWKNSFESFSNWALSNGYADNLTIDRIDTNDNYCPENCKWSTEKEQNSNKRNNHILSYNGKSQTIQQWSEETGICFTTILYRVNHGWPIERALTQKPK